MGAAYPLSALWLCTTSLFILHIATITMGTGGWKWNKDWSNKFCPPDVTVLIIFFGLYVFISMYCICLQIVVCIRICIRYMYSTEPFLWCVWVHVEYALRDVLPIFNAWLHIFKHYYVFLIHVSYFKCIIKIFLIHVLYFIHYLCISNTCYVF